MDYLHLSVIAVVLSFHLPGSVGTNSQQILLATQQHSACQWDGELVLNCSFTGIAVIPEDVSQTAVTADFSYNNIRTFLCPDGRNKEWVLKHLNLSNNLISELSIATFRNFPVLETLNLNGNAIHTLTLDTLMPAQGSKCCHLLPALKVLSVEKNNLNTVPRGLCLLQSLQTVHLSSNGIQQIDRNDFQNCSQLKDIDLQNNKITKIHPEAFRDLHKLQVVNLHGNVLTNPLPQIFISLNNFQIEVHLSNNTWIFNCRLNAFKHLLQFLFDSTRQKWSISYNISANNSQKPLLYLSSFYLNCRDSVLFKRAVIPPGKTSVLKCDLDNKIGNGVSWWTPKGRISEDNSFPHMTLDKMNNLVIYNAEETAGGLYLCHFNTTKKKYLIYNVQVKERISAYLVRKTRDTSSVFRQGRTEQDFALAVCLSVLITFAFAFCLGAFARPYLVSLWRLIHGSKNSHSEHTYSNQAFSDENLSRECSARKPTNVQHNFLICDGDSSRNTCIFPAETSNLHENIISSKESNNEINMKENTTFSDIKTSISNDGNRNVNGLFSVRIDNKNSNEGTPRKLMSNGISLWKDSKYANNEGSEKSRFPPIPRRLNANSYTKHTDSSDLDLPFTGEAGFPFPTTQTRTVAQDSRKSKARNNSGLLQSEITKATPNFPERQSIVSHNEHRSTTKFMPQEQSCDEQPGPNSNINKNSDVGDFILPSSCKRATNSETLSTYQTIESSALTAYNCKTEHTNEKDLFDDSSSDEGTPFTMSDCSSLADCELEQPDGSDNLPTCQSSLEEAGMNSGTEKFSTLPESPDTATELQHTGKNGDKNKASFESTINYGSDTTMPEAPSPYTARCSDQVSTSDSDILSSSSQEVPNMFHYFTKAALTVQNSPSDSLHSQSTDFGSTLHSLKDSATYDTDRESTPGEAELQLYQFPIEPQHSLNFNPTEQNQNAEGSADEHTSDRKSSEKNHGEGDITLKRNMSASEDNDFICAPIDTGLNETVKETLLLHSSNESSLQSLPEHTAERHFTVIAEKEDLLPQEKQVSTTKVCTDKRQGVFNAMNCDGHTEFQDTNNCSLPETQSCNLTADLLHLYPFGKSQSVFKGEDCFQLDQSEKDADSFSVPQGCFNESTLYSSCSFPQKTTENIISTNTDSSKMEDDTTLTELENNSTTATNLQNSSEKLSQDTQAN
ncbi:leucine-rich repeat-containing protein 66 [Calypte anna]|uniref:leucine-rich repeat-containing protein 66 n=1 Tax=Calypte anna TaxID=9244 RepID=UPI0011C34B0E|nr:leucine-rich repeat-containing protein 66 [Calypte anna]